jgi:hypothetical protein
MIKQLGPDNREVPNAIIVETDIECRYCGVTWKRVLIDFLIESF